MNPADVAALIKREITQAFQDISDRTYYQGEIDAVVDEYTADILLEGNTTVMPAISSVRSYRPKVGDRVLVLSIGRSGANHVILGRISGTDSEFLRAYPIGSIYISVVNTNPSSYFGGTWVAFGAGRTLVGVDGTQTEFNTVEKTGGHKLMQAHTHTGTTASNGAHTHNYTVPYKTQDAPYGGYARVAWEGYQDLSRTTGSSGAHTHTFTTNSAGGGDSQNLQPYITCYMWRRTA